MSRRSIARAIHRGVSRALDAVSQSGAAVINYLLRQTFTGGDVGLADTNTITGPGEGGTFASSDVDDTGTWNVREQSTATVAIASNRLVLDNQNTATGANCQITGQTPVLTATAGTVAKGVLNYAEAEIIGGKIAQFVLHNSTAPVDGTTAVCGLALGCYSGSVADWRTYTYSAVGTSAGALTSNAGINGTADTDYEWALVRGGWTSGVPDASGTDGFSTFWKNGSNWTLLHSSPNAAWQANNYLGVNLFEAAPATATDSTVRFDNLKLTSDNLTVAEVFTPTGYFYDSFTEASDTALTSHTPDTGGTWGVADGTYLVTGNALKKTVLNNTNNQYTYIDMGMTNIFATYKNQYSSDSGTTGMFLRQSSGTGWVVRPALAGASSILFIYEKTTSTTYTDRGNVSFAATNDNPERLSVRFSGDTIEAWYKPAGSLVKASYTSASRNNTSTIHGLDFYGTAGQVDDFLVLPLTSADYTTALDAV